MTLTDFRGNFGGMPESAQQSAIPPAGTQQKRIPGRPFVKNDARIKQNMEKAAVGGGSSAPESSGVSTPAAALVLVPVDGEGLLAAMRHVLVNPRGFDLSEEQKQARGWLKDDRAGFFREKSKLEQAEMAMKARSEPVEAAAVEDVGTGAALSLLAELMARHKETT